MTLWAVEIKISRLPRVMADLEVRLAQPDIDEDLKVHLRRRCSNIWTPSWTPGGGSTTGTSPPGTTSTISGPPDIESRMRTQGPPQAFLLAGPTPPPGPGLSRPRRREGRRQRHRLLVGRAEHPAILTRGREGRSGRCVRTGRVRRLSRLRRWRDRPGLPPMVPGSRAPLCHGRPRGSSPADDRGARSPAEYVAVALSLASCPWNLRFEAQVEAIAACRACVPPGDGFGRFDIEREWVFATVPRDTAEPLAARLYAIATHYDGPAWWFDPYRDADKAELRARAEGLARAEGGRPREPIGPWVNPPRKLPLPPPRTEPDDADEYDSYYFRYSRRSQTFCKMAIDLAKAIRAARLPGLRALALARASDPEAPRGDRALYLGALDAITRDRRAAFWIDCHDASDARIVEAAVAGLRPTPDHRPTPTSFNGVRSMNESRPSSDRDRNAADAEQYRLRQAEELFEPLHAVEADDEKAQAEATAEPPAETQGVTEKVTAWDVLQDHPIAKTLDTETKLALLCEYIDLGEDLRECPWPTSSRRTSLLMRAR